MKIREGSSVIIKYIGTFPDGSIFEVRGEDDSVTIDVGKGQVMKKIEDALIGKKEGDTISVPIGHMDAYGKYDEDLVFSVPLTQEVYIDRENYDEYKDFADGIEIGKVCTIPSFPKELQVDQVLNYRDGKGNESKVIVKEVLPDRAIMDANHPLVGRDLVYNIHIVSVS
jgi:FKBP-type peptidyl-prolyl cis-trans isomerase 2